MGREEEDVEEPQGKEEYDENILNCKIFLK